MRDRLTRVLFAPLALAALLLAGFFLSSCYVVTEGLRYLAIRSEAESIERVLARPDTSAELRALLERSVAVRAYAIGELGLKETRNYTSVVELESDSLATVVQACAELSFDRWLWSYPLVGALPYRGYFKIADAQKEAARLRAKGLDVIVRPVDAFSTLGYLSDPLFSFMASYDEAAIAELVIHEMTHATVFILGKRVDPESGKRVDIEGFNEELATFVAREGALRYLASLYGRESPQAASAAAQRRDAEAFATYLRGTAEELEIVYRSAAADEEKRAAKAAIIAGRAALYAERYDELFETESFRAAPMARINNAYLDLYRLYEGESDLYGEYLAKACGGDMRRFMERVARIADEADDPRRAMREETAAATR